MGKGPASPISPEKWRLRPQRLGSSPTSSWGCFGGVAEPSWACGTLGGLCEVGGLSRVVTAPHSRGSGLVPPKWRLVDHPVPTCQPQGLRPTSAGLPREPCPDCPPYTLTWELHQLFCPLLSWTLLRQQSLSSPSGGLPQHILHLGFLRSPQPPRQSSRPAQAPVPTSLPIRTPHLWGTGGLCPPPACLTSGARRSQVLDPGGSLTEP